MTARCALAFVVLVALLACACAATDVSMSHFNLKPDIPSQVRVARDGYECVFSYAANGGSSEEWRIELEQRSDYEVSCIVGRPSPPSYLYFNEYSLSIKGADEVVEATVFGNDGPVPKGSFEVDEATFTLRNAAAWTGTVSMVELTVE